MRHLTHRQAFVSIFSLLTVLVGLFSAGPALAQLPTPSQPILVVQNTASSDPYQNFVPELLTTEGLNGFQTAQLPALTSAFLANYDVVVLPHLTLTSAQATLFQNYVNAGGTLIGFRPDQQLAAVFGVNVQGTTLSEAWLQINTATPYGIGLVSNVLRFHGTADQYAPLTATSLATLYTDVHTATAFPAMTVNTYGSGTAILFSFDLSQSIVLLRQGNPAWAGYPNNHDGYNTMRASQMFMDQGTKTYWNDLGDGTLNDIPQADEEMRLFSNAVTLANAAKRPLPRLWYYPSQWRSLVLFTGDHHGDASSDSTSEIAAVQAAGGDFQEYLWMDPVGSITSSQVQNWQSQGNTFGVHLDDTGEADASGVGGSHATWSGMNNVINTDLNALTSAFPSVSNPPVTNRDHFLIWVSNNSAGTADQTAQAELFQNYGIQMDLSYSAFPSRWGYMNGSGLPMRFLNTTTGSVIPVYEQATQYEDDVQLSSAYYSFHWDLATAQTHYQQSLSDNLTKYNGVTTFLFHPDHWNTADPVTGDGNYQTIAATVLQYAKANNIPMVSADNWATYLAARRAATFSEPSFVSNGLSFTVTAAPANATILIPEQSGSRIVSTMTVDAAPKTITVMNLQGILYASVVVSSGTHSVTAQYAAAGTISGTISPAAASTSIQIASSSVSLTVVPAANGTFTTGPLPSGSYTITPSSSSYTFSPTSSSKTLTTAGVTGVNFTSTAKTPPGETIFTTQTPNVTSASDGAGVNYEMGTAFTSDVAGQITGVRFYKADGETGTHTGHVWAVNGTLLASVTFTGETATGWQTQSLATPLAIAANTIYAVSVNTGNSFYVDTVNGLAGQVVNQDLTTLKTPNGLYANVGVFPTNTYSSSNYFRDIVFSPGSTYSASGSITPTAGGAGATVTLSGLTNGTTTADGSGNFSFSNLANGSYTVTPTLSGYTYTPTSLTFAVSNGNVTGLAFTVVPQTYTITGTISGTGGNAATVTLSGSGSATTTANSSGVYTFTSVGAGSYTVTPSKTGFAFTPVSSPVTVSNANITGVNFSSTAAFSISGTISGAGGNAATVTLSGSGSATTTANSSGVYTFTGIVAGTYTVTPSNTGYTFSPASLNETVSSANITGVNFSTLYSISGTVSGGSGATVKLTGTATATVTANGSGAYSFTGLGAGSYTVTPTLNGVTFTPLNAPATISNANVTGVNFSVALSNYTISGTISGAGGNAASVALTGSATATVTANSSGVYTFTGLSNGSYTVSPSASGYTFSPISSPVTINNASVSSVNFSSSAANSQTIFTSQTPGTTGANDTVAYELGTLFQSTKAGQITAVRFWKDSNETGTHTGHIWSATGTLLATVTFTGETTSGWQSQNLTTPLSITANTTYTVSVNTGNDYYVSTTNGLASTVTNSNLSTVVGNNGVFGTAGAFPTGSWNHSNYFRDVTFVPAVVSSETLFTNQAPTVTGGNDTVAYELGTLFQSDTAGQISAIRFWKDSNETGTHTGHIWSATGTLLATVTFTNETASGWQTQNLTTPLSITANTTYTVSVNTGNDYYVATDNGLASQITNIDLSSVVGNNGVFGTAGAFPTGSWNHSNYFRDVVFVP